MNGPRSDEQALLEELAAQARQEAAESGPGDGTAPSPEELVDYLAGRLPPEAEERVGRWIVADPETARAAVDLADLQSAADGAVDAGPPDVATRAGWKALHGRLRGDGARAVRRHPLLLAAAALLILLTAALAQRVVTLQRQLDRPLANLASAELVAGSRDAGTLPEIALLPGAPLLLVLEPEQRCAGYDAVLHGPGGAEPTSVPGLLRDPRGQLTLLLRPAAGAHRLELYGCTPRRLLEEHRFRIVQPAAGGDG